MDPHSNPRRALKSAQKQEDRRPCRNERDRARCAPETAEQRNKRLRKRRERDCARRAAQTASERQATSQHRSTRECERMTAEIPEERERRLQEKSTREQQQHWNEPVPKCVTRGILYHIETVKFCIVNLFWYNMTATCKFGANYFYTTGVCYIQLFV